ncbi:hypothetical protein V6N13_104575 [Hibiscus sabdariffa]
MVEEVGRNISEVVVRSGLILEEVDESPARSSHVVEEMFLRVLERDDTPMEKRRKTVVEKLLVVKIMVVAAPAMSTFRITMSQRGAKTSTTASPKAPGFHLLFPLRWGFQLCGLRSLLRRALKFLPTSIESVTLRVPGWWPKRSRLWEMISKDGDLFEVNMRVAAKEQKLSKANGRNNSMANEIKALR